MADDGWRCLGTESRWLFVQLMVDAHEEIAEGESDGVRKLLGENGCELETINDCSWSKFIDTIESFGDKNPYPVIVFAGHAKEQGLCFGKDPFPEVERVARLLGSLDNLHLLILNACSTELLARSVLKFRRKSDLVIMCWSSQVEDDGARIFNLAFCRALLTRLKIAEAGDEKRTIFRAAFQDALEKIASTKHAGTESERAFYRIAPIEPNGQDDNRVLGEPMLLPFVSTEGHYLYKMIAKHKVADTGFELVKRLKTIVKNGYLSKGGDFGKLTTLFQIGEFLGWMQVLGSFDPNNENIQEVERAFTVEEEYLLRKDQIAEIERSFSEKNSDIEKRIERYKAIKRKTVQKSEAIKNIQSTPENMEQRMSLKAELAVLYKEWQNERGEIELVRETQNQLAQEKIEREHAARDRLIECKGGFPARFSGKKVEYGLLALYKLDLRAIGEVMHDPRITNSIMSFIEFQSMWERDTEEASHKMQEMKLAFAKLSRDIDELLKGDYYICCGQNGEKLQMRRNVNIYYRIAWIHDAVLDLVMVLDPGPRLDPDHPNFWPFCRVDSALARNEDLSSQPGTELTTLQSSPTGRTLLFGMLFGAAAAIVSYRIVSVR